MRSPACIRHPERQEAIHPRGIAHQLEHRVMGNPLHSLLRPDALHEIGFVTQEQVECSIGVFSETPNGSPDRWLRTAGPGSIGGQSKGATALPALNPVGATTDQVSETGV